MYLLLSSRVCASVSAAGGKVQKDGEAIYRAIYSDLGETEKGKRIKQFSHWIWNGSLASMFL